MRTREELAWAAGLFDGEGSFYVKHSNPRGKLYKYAALELSQTHPEVLERFREAVGLGTVHGPYNPSKKTFTKKQYYQLAISGFEKTQAVIVMLWPWLGSIKRAQAIEVLKEMRAYQEEKANG